MTSFLIFAKFSLILVGGPRLILKWGSMRQFDICCAMDNIKVSVLMNCFNGEAFEEAIRSILAKTSIIGSWCFGTIYRPIIALRFSNHLMISD